MIDEKMAEKAWKIAEYLINSTVENIQISGVEWTGIAKVLDEIASRKSWGILEYLKKCENDDFDSV